MDGAAKIATPLNKHLNNTDKNVLLSEDAHEGAHLHGQHFIITQLRFSLHIRD